MGGDTDTKEKSGEANSASWDDWSNDSPTTKAASNSGV